MTILDGLILVGIIIACGLMAMWILNKFKKEDEPE